MGTMSPENANYLVCFMLDICFAVGSGILYTLGLHTEDRLLAGCSAFCYALSCVGSAIFLERLV